MTTQTDVDDFFAHHGVKGMKWGVRRDAVTGVRPIAKTLNDSAFGQKSIARANAYGAKQDAKIAKKRAKAVAKSDKAYKDSLVGIHGYVKVNNAIAERINPRLEKLNSKPEYTSVDLTKNPKLHQKYINEYRSLLQTSLNEVSDSIGTNASGTQKLALTLDGQGLNTSWRADFVDIKHAVSDTAFRIVPTFNATGHITGFELKPIDEDLKHMDEVDEFLAHFGVKGMRWGVRREDGSASERKPLTDRQKTALKVAGGTAVAVGAATAAYLIGRSGGKKAAEIYAGRQLELGQARIGKSIADLYRNRTLDKMGFEMASYVVQDTFNNRMFVDKNYNPKGRR